MTPSAQREPNLLETLDDPIIRLMMLRDGVSREEILRLKSALRLSSWGTAKSH